MIKFFMLLVMLVTSPCHQKATEAPVSDAPVPAPLYCRIKVAGSSDELLVGVTASRFLVSRDGKFDSDFRSYPRTNGNLNEDVKIPPVSFGETILTIKSCRDVGDKVLVLDVHLNRKDESAQQQCWVELLPKSSELNTAVFDGKFTIRPAERQKAMPIKFVLGGEPTAILAVVSDIGGGKYKNSIRSVVGGECAFPDGVRPTVTVTYPSSDSKKTIEKEYELYGFC